MASLGLVKAIERFDLGQGTAFSTFAVPTILGELRRHLRDHSWSVHVPRGLQELAQRLGPASDQLAARYGRPATVTELAHDLGVSDEAVLDARQALAAHSPASLDQPVAQADGAAPLGELLGDEDRALDTVEKAVMLERYLAELPTRNREVLRLRFAEDLKQREIGARLGISQMHVSRLLRQSLERLRSISSEVAG